MLLFVTFICVIGSALTDKLPTNYGSPAGQQPTYGGSDDQPNYNDQPTYGNELSADEQNLKMLMNSVPGTPGEDYPIFSEVPESKFSCKGQKVGGYYADPEAQCQVFHVCAEDGDGPRSKWSFLCPNGTIFNQNYFICDWWFNFDCSTAEGLYSLNDQLGETGDNLASYNAAESQNVPTYQTNNQASYNGPAPAPRKAPAPPAQKPKAAAPKPKSGNGAKAAAPGNYGAPSAQAPGSYGAPAAQATGNSYGAPEAASSPANYGAPADTSYGAPSDDASANTNYGAPSDDASANSNYGAPSDDYESANTNYGAPSDDEGLPDYSSSASDNYGAPADTSYGAPTPADSGYGAPTQPSTLYGAPAAPEAPIGDYNAGARAGRQRNGKSAFNRNAPAKKNLRG